MVLKVKVIMKCIRVVYFLLMILIMVMAKFGALGENSGVRSHMEHKFRRHKTDLEEKIPESSILKLTTKPNAYIFQNIPFQSPSKLASNHQDVKPQTMIPVTNKLLKPQMYHSDSTRFSSDSMKIVNLKYYDAYLPFTVNSKLENAKETTDLILEKFLDHSREKNNFHFLANNDNDYYYDYFGDDSTYDFKDETERLKKTTHSQYIEKEVQMQSDYLNDGYYNYVDDQPTTSGENTAVSLTEEKWRNYGTPEAVEKSRRQHLFENSVTAHITRVHYQAECKVPKAKIIQITEASKRYVPHCTVLHRCGDDTGCCHSDRQTCYPKSTRRVTLYFYAITVGANEPQIETLYFENHTECHCIEKSRLRNSIRPTTAFPDTHETSCKCTAQFEVFKDEEQSDNIDANFSAVNESNRCRCDCVSSNHNCEQQKKGMEAFSVEDRRCISDGNCIVPACEYGQYTMRIGRCPKMQEKFETARRISFDRS